MPLLLLGCVALLQTAMFRGDLAHTAVYGDTGIARLAGVKWRFHTGGRVIASPAIAGRTAYVGSTDGNLYAVDLDHGTLRWKLATGARVTSSPAVSNGVVYVVSYDGNLYAADASAGKLKWKFATRRRAAVRGNAPPWRSAGRRADARPVRRFLSLPAVSDGIVYFGSGDGYVYAVDAASGTLRWKYQTGDVIHASPAIAAGVVYIGSWDSWFYALDAATGTLKWRFKTGEDPDIHNQVGIQSSAAVAGWHGLLRVPRLEILCPRRTDWREKVVVRQPRLVGRQLARGARRQGVFWHERLQAHLGADAKTGATVFELPVRWYIFGSPAIAGHWLYVGNWDGTLTAVDLTTKKAAWMFQTDASRAHLRNVDEAQRYRAVLRRDGRARRRATSSSDRFCHPP